jgi:hypothetical protein
MEKPSNVWKLPRIVESRGEEVGRREKLSIRVARRRRRFKGFSGRFAQGPGGMSGGIAD